jgi:N-acetylglucosaminyldiphosphoundecaprenol N-acetyl-beta-D-mannosaminyltransferase
MTQRILIVQPGDIGDLVLSTPAIAALREAHPSAHITLLAPSHAAPVVEGTGLVDEIVTLERRHFNSSAALFMPGNLRRLLVLRRGGRYDALLFFRQFTLRLGTIKYALISFLSGARRRVGLQNGNGWFLTDSIPDTGFGAKHQAQYWLDLVALLGAESSPRPARIAVTDVELPPAGKRIVIHAGSGGYSPARRWDVEKFAAVADSLHAEYNAQTVLVGGPDDDSAAVSAAMQNQPHDLSGKTSLAELAGVISQADLFIGADSGVMHIAAAVGTPVVAVFGPSNHQAWGPWMPGTPSAIIRSAPLCSPCSYVGHGIGLREGCPARTCMRMVTAEQVIDAARALLNGETIEQPPQPERGESTERIRVLSLPVDAITYERWLELIGKWVRDGGRCRQVCTTNPEFMMIARHDPNFRNILNRADLCVPDGVGLLWAARYLGNPLPERVTGSDGLPVIAERAARESWRLYFLGAAPGVAEKAADVLRERYPGLQIAGVYAGSPTPEEEDAIVQRINESGADLLFVAYGAPEQDKWIARNLPRLRVTMAMGVGGAFDFIAGVLPRAPLWMRRFGLEWLYRLYLQPWRIGRMSRLPRFVLLVLLRGRSNER